MEKEIALIDENLLKSKIYTIRGVKVMLDADLAEIYGYSTKRFNEQVKANIERFDDDFRFQLTKEDVDSVSRSVFPTLKIERGHNIKYLPYAFTEQGIYMLMSVLRGDLAVRQSKSLIRLFKQMKDYIVAENQSLFGVERIAQIERQTLQNTLDITKIQQNVDSLNNSMKNVASDLQKVMDNFIDPSTHRHFLILNGQKLEADVAYTQIYGMAKKSIIMIDDYVGVKSLDLLRGIARGVSVTIYSDERGPERLTESLLADFRAARPDVTLDVRRTNRRFHDRYIFLDYNSRVEKLFHCGASSKDAGGKITTIMQVECPRVYHSLMEGL